MAEITAGVKSKSKSTLGHKIGRFALHNSVTILFLIICLIGIKLSGLPLFFIVNELLTRVTRNTFLVLALLIPVMAGMGLNFSIVVGAMAGQIALIAVTYWGIGGQWGLFLSFALAAPVAVLFGKLTGMLLNKTKGQEMIASMFVGFFANGIYQLIFLFLVGTFIPMTSKRMLLSSGMGLRNTVDLSTNESGTAGIKYALDSIWKVPFFYVVIVATVVAIAWFAYKLLNSDRWHKEAGARKKDIRNIVVVSLVAVFSMLAMFAPNLLPKQLAGFGRLKLSFFTALAVASLAIFNQIIVKTKLGQDFRTVGQDKHIAKVAGLQVNKIRELAITLSTVFAAWGQIIFLQNMGMLSTYGSHVQIATFAIAALLIGGASVSKATIGQAFLGVILFHTLFIVSPAAGKNLFGDAQLGEFFRTFVAYGVIGVALGLHAWKVMIVASQNE